MPVIASNLPRATTVHTQHQCAVGRRHQARMMEVVTHTQDGLAMDEEAICVLPYGMDSESDISPFRV